MISPDSSEKSFSKPFYSFSWTLPVLALFIASLFVGSALPGMIRVHKTANDSTAIKDLKIDPAVIDKMLRESKTKSHISLPTPLQMSALLNIPAMLVEIAIDLPTTWPMSWYPKLPFPFDDMWFWRAISWPIYTIPLWWLAGRAIDALRQKVSVPFNPRIRSIEAIFMGAIGIVCGVCGIGLFFTASSENTDDGLRWIVIPSLLWFSFGLASVIAWIRQRRLRIRTAQ